MLTESPWMSSVNGGGRREGKNEVVVVVVVVVVLVVVVWIRMACTREAIGIRSIRIATHQLLNDTSPLSEIN
jgi:hypothetical protein